jgi:uncharacterized protein (DUF1697 family)
VVHIALLRGINVGRAKRIAMADLRSLVEKLGYRDVKTLLNSGNVVFTSDGGSAQESAKRIEAALVSQLGISSKITGLDAADLATVIDENPFLEAIESPSRFLISIVGNPADLNRVDGLLDRDRVTERVAVGSRAVYQFSPDGILEGKAVEAVARALGDTATARNWATLGKIAVVAEGLRTKTG